MIGYHFTGERLWDGRPIPLIGEWLVHDGPVVPCKCGLHASEHPADALEYAPGPLLHRVELEGDLLPHGSPVGKWVGRRRRILATIDATGLLREYARWCALQVIDRWNAPSVVRQYLETGDESLRAAAQATVQASAWASAWSAAWDAARAAAAWEAAAQAAARDAARAAARAAVAWASAWVAQRQQLATMVDAAFAEKEAT